MQTQWGLTTPEEPIAEWYQANAGEGDKEALEEEMGNVIRTALEEHFGGSFEGTTVRYIA